MIRKAVANISAYKPPLEERAGGDYLLLDFNERTERLPKHIGEALKDFIDADGVRIYPSYGNVLGDLAAYVGVNTDALLLTNGSDKGIEVVYASCTEPGGEAIVPGPTFAMLDHCARVQGLKIHTPEYQGDFEYPLAEVLECISERTQMITVCNPNSPHGTVLAPEKVLELAAAAPHAAVLVDECYFEYAGASVVDAVLQYKNLFVARSFSKTWGLAALRLGYVVSHPENIVELTKVRGPYEVNGLAAVALKAALADSAYVQDYAKEIIERARPFFESFLKESGIPFVPSQANFVLTFPKDAAAMEQHLRQHGILVRPRSGPHIENTLRFSIGTLADMQRVVEVLSTESFRSESEES